jgi:hypothetical protein
VSGGAEPPAAPEPRRAVLSPDERASEILFGLIMVMTFTGSISAATAGREDVREMLIAAVGCNVAWGAVDAAMYLMTTLTTRGSAIETMRRLRAAASPGEARDLIAEALPGAVAKVMREEEFADLRSRLVALPEPPPAPSLTKDDYVGALGVFLLVALSTLPVAVPFLLVENTQTAVRLSHGIAIAIMFSVGLSMGRRAGLGPRRMGLAIAALGVALAALTMALGG